MWVCTPPRHRAALPGEHDHELHPAAGPARGGGVYPVPDAESTETVFRDQPRVKHDLLPRCGVLGRHGRVFCGHRRGAGYFLCLFCDPDCAGLPAVVVPLCVCDGVL